MAEALSSLLDTGATSETSDVATGTRQKAKRPKPAWVTHREEVTGESWGFNEDSGKWEKQKANVGSKNVQDTFGIEKGAQPAGLANADVAQAEPQRPWEVTPTDQKREELGADSAF